MAISVEAWLARIGKVKPSSIAMGLERVSIVRNSLVLCPAFPVVTVTGTNGKGSTCAILEEILCCGGYRVGCYTSPHLSRFNERVRINKEVVADDALIDGLAAVDDARRDVPLTYFEYATLAAMWIFCKENVDVCVLEVGLGGRLDAVNAFDCDCGVVTSIGVDHVEYLGSTRDRIAYEKAHIFRRDKPAVCTELHPPRSLIDHCSLIGARLLRLGHELRIDTNTEETWVYSGPAGRFELPIPALHGEFQVRNACAAVTVSMELAARGIEISGKIIGDALRSVTLPGRYHCIKVAPRVILDVAHNPEAAKALASTLQREAFSGRTLAVFGMLIDKDIGSVAGAMTGIVSMWHVCELGVERGAAAEQLHAELLRLDVEALRIRESSDPVTAYHLALEEADECDRIIVFGSFHTVAPVLAHESGASR